MNNKILQKREKVAKIIRDTRVQKGWSQGKLAKDVGYSISTIQRIEACKFSPNADQLYIILEVLGLDFKIINSINT